MSREWFGCCTGEDFTLCLGEEGDVYGFGNNASGQLGIKEAVADKIVSAPRQLQSLSLIKSISCGRGHSVCIDDSGTVWSFGVNNRGQLGTGSKTAEHSPRKIALVNLQFKSVFCGASHTLLITTDFELYSCGSNEYGELCLGNIGFDVKVPKKSPYQEISYMAAGCGFTLFQNIVQHNIFACGRNDKYQLGLGKEKYIAIPRPIPNLPENIQYFTCGMYHSLILTDDGTVYSLGENNNLGNTSVRKSDSPVKITNIPLIINIACGFDRSYIVDEDGKISFFNTTLRLQVIPINGQIRHVSNGFGKHCLVKLENNDVYCFGENAQRQLGILTNSSAPTKFTPARNDLFVAFAKQSSAKSARK